MRTQVLRIATTKKKANMIPRFEEIVKTSKSSPHSGSQAPPESKSWQEKAGESERKQEQRKESESKQGTAFELELQLSTSKQQPAAISSKQRAGG